MAADHPDVRSPLQRRELWKVPLVRALLLGTTDQSSVLSLLPKGHSLVNVILSPVVLHYEDEADAIDLHEGAEQGALTKWQMVLVACFAPGRVNEPEGKYKWTPLHLAADTGQSKAVQLLLAADSDPNAQNHYKETPLHCAADKGHSETLQLLLAADGDPNAKNHRKWTPLHTAVVYGHSRIVQLLLAADSDPNAQDHDKWTPLRLAEENSQYDCAQLLENHTREK